VIQYVVKALRGVGTFVPKINVNLRSWRVLLGRIAAGRKPNVQSPDQRGGALDAFRTRRPGPTVRIVSDCPKIAERQQIRKICSLGHCCFSNYDFLVKYAVCGRAARGLPPPRPVHGGCELFQLIGSANNRRFCCLWFLECTRGAQGAVNTSFLRAQRLRLRAHPTEIIDIGAPQWILFLHWSSSSLLFA
jgi:hypothetical protein